MERTLVSGRMLGSWRCRWSFCSPNSMITLETRDAQWVTASKTMNGPWASERSLSPEEAEQWEELIDTIKEVEIINTPGRVTWAMEKSGQYTTRSMYRMLFTQGVINYRMKRIGAAKSLWNLRYFSGWSCRIDCRPRWIWKRSGKVIIVICFL